MFLGNQCLENKQNQSITFLDTFYDFLYFISAFKFQTSDVRNSPTERVQRRREDEEEYRRKRLVSNFRGHGLYKDVCVVQ
jgi:hypothetical protein